MLAEGEAVGEEAVAAVGGGLQRVQRLKSRDGFAIGIVGVQSWFAGSGETDCCEAAVFRFQSDGHPRSWHETCTFEM
jgi:hypothetical protein